MLARPGRTFEWHGSFKVTELLDKTLMNMRDEAQCARRDRGYDGRR